MTVDDLAVRFAVKAGAALHKLTRNMPRVQDIVLRLALRFMETP
jgi:hypothetical protein